MVAARTTSDMKTQRLWRTVRSVCSRFGVLQGDNVTQKKAPEKKPKLRDAHCFEACADGALIIYATMPDGDGEPIRIDPHRVSAVLAACGDALARKASRR